MVKRPTPPSLTCRTEDLLSEEAVQAAQKIVNHRGSVHYMLVIQRAKRVSLKYGEPKRYLPPAETLSRLNDAGDRYEVLEVVPEPRRPKGGRSPATRKRVSGK